MLIFSSVFKGMQWKTVLTQRIFYAHLVGIFFLSWGWKSITVLLVCIYSLISCPSLRCAYINWKTPLFLFIGKLMTCKEDKLVSLKSIKPLIRQIKLRVISQVILYHVSSILSECLYIESDQLWHKMMLLWYTHSVKPVVSGQLYLAVTLPFLVGDRLVQVQLYF